MQVNISYGRNGLTVNIPDHAKIIRSNQIPRLIDEELEIIRAIQNPISSPSLGSLVSPGNKVCIVHTDITRPTPNNLILPAVIDELERVGIHPKDIFLLNGLGTHRFQTKKELDRMLGTKITRNYRCIQHDPKNKKKLVDLGITSFGNPIRINRNYFEADIKILTGFIEPHFFAGFSGGPKAILPAIAGFESVWTNHSPANIGHPAATWGVTIGNPIWEEMKEVALRTQLTFLINVTLNSDGGITGVFAGDMITAHAEGCEFVKKNAVVLVEGPFDIVVTTNSGYPLDQNLYQSIKGISTASRIVKTGGSIISAVACEEGIPDYGGYKRLLKNAKQPDDLLTLINTPGFKELDQWQVQIQALVQQKADVYIYSDGLSDEEIRGSLFIPCRDIPATIDMIAKRYEKGVSIAVLPEGPQTIPVLVN